MLYSTVFMIALDIRPMGAWGSPLDLIKGVIANLIFALELSKLGPVLDMMAE
jgi:hypothetical protein